LKPTPQLLTWIPPFVVGLSAAVAGELAVGLLLYSSPGFLPALTLILAVLLGSLALGLWTAPPVTSEAYGESLRRRWLLALVAYAGGSAVSGAWSVQRGLAGDALSRGVGLALLAALPLYACGALLGAMPSRRWPWTRIVPVGACAMAGAALGAMLAGYVLVSFLLPVSIYAFCLVLLSGGALVHGIVLTGAGERRTLMAVLSPFGRVRVEEWSWGKKARAVRVVLENERVRGAEDADGWPARRWESAALDLASRTISTSEPQSVLVLGGGIFTLARQLLGRHENVRVDVAERNPAILLAGAEHFGVPAEHPRLRIVKRGPVTSLELCPGPYVVTLVDGAGLPSIDPVPLPGRSWLAELRDRSTERGIVMVGGIDRGPAHGLPLERLMSEGGSLFPTLAVYGARSEPGPISRPPIMDDPSVRPGELLLVFSPDAGADFPADLKGLALESVQRTAVSEPVDIGSLR
jgi:hypothetical protein